MSKTEILTPQVQERQIENQINRAVRHCRIGKVVEKYKRQYRPLEGQPIMPVLPLSPWFPGPHDPPLYPLGLQGSRKCSCKPGSACNNVACPYRLIVTSASKTGGYSAMTTANRLGLDAYGA